MLPAPRLTKLAVIATLALVLAACSGGSSKPAASTSSQPSAGSGPLDRFGTVWLCRPGLADDPCASNLSTTVVAPSGATSVLHLSPATKPAVDCFYVYPTISGQPTINATRTIDFREREVAIAQASQFSQVCRVYAPIYRQITLSALERPARITLADALIAYDSVLAAFRDYLDHYNDGRGIVFIGHSQGALILIRLLEQEVDGTPLLRHRLVSALLMGGNLTVPKGRRVGGDFAHIPACVSDSETGCVVAYSSFASKPPPGSEFGTTTSDAGVGLLGRRKLSSRLRIMCVNPAAPAGGSAELEPMIPSLVLAFLAARGSVPSVSTPWVSFPGEYSARCETSGDATWLQVTRLGAREGHQPLLTGLDDPALGLHILDVNIALGNLVRLVGAQAAAYARR